MGAYTMGAKGFIAPLLGALQACVTVLLTICYGVAAQRLQLIRRASIDDMAGLGVKLFLPALIVVHLGEQLHAGNVINYVPVLAWATIYTGSSIAVAYAISRIFNLPSWVMPTCAFNNTTSLPLLLLQSLESVGSLQMIIRHGDTVSNAVQRAQSYFLVCAVVSKTIGYAVGPKMLETQNGNSDVHESRVSEPDHDQEDTEAGAGAGAGADSSHPANDGVADGTTVTEETHLLPERAHKASRQVKGRFRFYCSHIFSFLPRQVKHELLIPFESPFADVMAICTVVGAVLGSVPSLHKAFFNHPDRGGIFTAWLTSSIKNIGKLFTTLQIFIVGGKLGVSFERMAGGSGRIPFRAIVTIFLFRLVLWPAISISLIYALAKKTNILQDDPILWFSMMLMPAGPPALVISGLAELARIPEAEEIAVAKTLTVSLSSLRISGLAVLMIRQIMYALSPFVCFSITGALKACEAVLAARD